MHKNEKPEETVKEPVADLVEEVKPLVNEKVAKTKQAAGDFESFTAEMEGVATARLETFYGEGIHAKADSAKSTEKELLALKGIGPATIKQLKELGVKVKA
ncbi:MULTISPECIES: hypothetical protein [unclassified Streptococcus]|uniref:hypothetical protein n=1 Tax=Streptococcus sp. X16XC17 TaxID=2316646 RepID=UPI00066FE087|nr:MULTISPECIES: hypothetical protein [unclassified Streptococcus]